MPYGPTFASFAAYTQGDAQHIVHVGVDKELHELWHVPGPFSWATTPLTGPPSPQGPSPSGSSPVAGYAHGDGQHVFYMTPNSDLHHLSWYATDGWRHDAVTGQAGPPPPNGAGMAAYATPDASHIAFVGQTGELFEAWELPDQNWRITNLTNAVVGNGDLPRGGPVAFVTADAEHVVVVGASGLHEFWKTQFDAWQRTDFDNAGRKAILGLNFQIAAYVTPDARHIVFAGFDQHVHELWQVPGSDWRQTDVTGAIQVPTPHPTESTRFAGYSTPDAQHILFVGDDGLLHEYWQVPGQPWQDTNLSSALPPGVSVIEGTDLVGYVTSDAEHVVLVGSDSHVHELWKPWGADHWSRTDVTQEAGTPDVFTRSAVT